MKTKIMPYIEKIESYEIDAEEMENKNGNQGVYYSHILNITSYLLYKLLITIRYSLRLGELYF